MEGKAVLYDKFPYENKICEKFTFLYGFYSCFTFFALHVPVAVLSFLLMEGTDRSYFRLSFNGQGTRFFSFSMATSIGLRVGKVVCRAISFFKRL